MPPRRRAEVGSSLEATRRVLRGLKASEVAPAHAALAEKLASTVDVTTAARDLGPLAKELRAVLAEVERIAKGVPEETSAVDRVAEQRARRLAAAAHPERPAVPE